MQDEEQKAMAGSNPSGDTAAADAVGAAPTNQTSPVLAKGSNWPGKTIFALGAGSVLLALVAGLGSGWGMWEFRFGFQLLLIAFVIALLAIVTGVGVGMWARRKGRVAPRPLRWAGMAMSAALALWLLSFAYTARTVPAIHDVSTDLADPPQFKTLALRKDYLDQIPGADDPEMRGMNPLQRWAAIHAKAYGDIRSVRIEMPVADAVAKAERLAQVRGWDIAVVDPVEGRVEATDTTRFFKFKDDVVVRVRPAENGRGSIVDMRSISRVGVSDLGVNAKRVRSFLADMAGTNPAG